MQQTERYYPQINSYNKPPSSTSISTDTAEAWLDRFPHKRAENKPNGGIIRSTADTREIFLRPMEKKERAAAIAQAQREHKQAMRNLAKQEAQDAKEIAKQLAEWRKESKPKPTAEELVAKKEAKRLKPNELNRIRREAEKKRKTKVEMPSKKGQEVLDKLKADGVFCVADWDMKRKYLSLIMSEVRALGYEIGIIKSGRLVTHYTMDKQ